MNSLYSKICHCIVVQAFCDSNPCLNNGQCIEGIGVYTCHCPFGFLGPKCDSKCSQILAEYSQECNLKHRVNITNNDVGDIQKVGVHAFMGRPHS